MTQRTQKYRYAMAGQFYAFAAFLSVVVGFIYLVMQGHPVAAGGLLAAEVMSLLGTFLRSRLREEA